MANMLPLSALEAIAAPDPALSHVSRIYCGRCIPGGELVTDEKLTAFVDDVVSAQFPAGFTVLNGTGGWRDHASGQTIRENTIVFEVMHGPEGEASVYHVARAYKAQFSQDAVGVTTTPVAVRFV